MTGLARILPASCRRPAAAATPNGSRLPAKCYLALCLVVMTLGALVPTPPSAHAPARHSVQWPSSWNGKHLVPTDASDDTGVFQKDFPGICREFALQTDLELAEGWMPGENRAVLRFVQQATRQLHPAQDCFRGVGYKIKPLTIEVDAYERKWRVFIAEKNGRHTPGPTYPAASGKRPRPRRKHRRRHWPSR